MKKGLDLKTFGYPKKVEIDNFSMGKKVQNADLTTFWYLKRCRFDNFWVTKKGGDFTTF